MKIQIEIEIILGKSMNAKILLMSSMEQEENQNIKNSIN